MKRVIRVFPRRTSATPNDELVAVNRAPELFDVADEVHISVTFTWDMDQALRLAEVWQMVAPVTVGGPATGDSKGDFVAGMYLKQGCTITSRGCPNQCWFCDVPRREGGLRELPIVDGWNVMDSNLLACSHYHIEAVFNMLSRQDNKPIFTGGLEARLLKPRHVELLRRVKAQRICMAYDAPSDWEPLVEAVRLLRECGYMARRSHNVLCYVLCGWENDTFEAAKRRVIDVYNLGILPMPMVYRNAKGTIHSTWAKWKREMGTNPVKLASTLRRIGGA